MGNIKYGIGLFLGGLLGVGAMSAQALDLGAMGNIDFSTAAKKAGTSDRHGSKNEFSVGAFDLYGNQQIDPNTRVFFESTFEANDSNEFGVDLERMFISRKFGNAFELSAGRFHTPLGYWNRTYHHGAIMYDTVDRPAILEFEDGADAIFPMHLVGVSGVGSVPSSAGKWTYEIAVGNSASIDSSGGLNPAASPGLGLSNVKSFNNTKAVVGRFIFQPEGVPMHFAVFGMNEPYAESADGTGILLQGSTLVSQRVLGFDTRYATPRFDATAEYFNINDDAHTGVGDGGSHTATAYYAQLGYRLTDALKAYYRYEFLDFNQNDAYFNLLGRTAHRLHDVGLRYDLDDSNAIKLCVDHSDPPSKTGLKSDTYIEIQWAFMLM